jgi:putative glycosyltransferase
MNDSGADVVYGVQNVRRGGFLERVSGYLFYQAINLLSVHQVPRSLVTVRLMTRRYVRALTAHDDRELFLAGLWTMTGFAQLPVTIVKGDKGSSTYTFRKKIANLVRAVTSFSAKPLVYVFHLGTLILLLSGAAAASIVVRWMLGGRGLAGWPSLIVAVWLFGGVSIFFIGILGVYLARLFLETKEWPLVVVREVRARAGDGR